MRVISGKYRGKKLLTIDDEKTRPTTDRVKENVFNLLPHQFISETKVCDVFGGSGQVGIEFASRGANFITINELNSLALDVIKKNIKNIEASFDLYNQDAFDLCKHTNTIFDYVYVDGPYNKYDINKLLKSFENNVHENSIFIIETSHEYCEDFDGYEILKNKKYGKSRIWIIKREY